MHLNLRKFLLYALAALVVPLLFLFFLAARNAKQSQEMQTCPTIDPALAYLTSQYNPTYELLREAPNAVPNTYWLNNDNSLAAFVFQRAGNNTEQNLKTALVNYDAAHTDLSKILSGTPVAYPPSVPAVVVKWQSMDGQVQIRDEIPGNDAFFEDWVTYSNLALLAALNEYNQRNPKRSLEIFNQALKVFDGKGFRDKAFAKNYETYKLAMAIYTGQRIGSEFPERDQMVKVLLSMQAESGGFYTHYDANFLPAGDTNTETSSWAILALQSAGCYIKK